VDLNYACPALEALGPVVDVEVHVSTYLARRLLAQGQRVPPPVRIDAIVDTGATWCVFKPDVFQQLSIQPYDEAAISTTSVLNELRNCYHVDISIGGHRIDKLTALEAPLGGCPAHGLIGRNVLSQGVLLYDGRLKRFTLTFG
jgi:predicted aspartyl protease